MDRRDALRAGTALTVGAVASACDAPSPARPSGEPSGEPSPATRTTPPAVPAPLEITHGPRDSARVALTFHGQGDPAVVGRLLDAIATGGARVTILAVGTWLAVEPKLGRRMLDAGHELGNHTQHHGDIARMNPTQAQTEIEECAQVLRSVTGSIGRWFRPSQTQHTTAAITAAAARVGYPTCLSYDVDSRDFTDPGAAAVVRNTMAGVRAGSIVSLHCGHAGTIEAMPALLRGLRQRGLAAVTMSELMA